MQKSNLQKYTNLSESSLRYYEPVSRLNTTQNIYEARMGNKQIDTFRKKKVSTCHQLNYSSCLNPFSRANFVRFDQKEIYNKKKKVPYASNAPTDPVTLRFQIPEKQVRVRPQFTTSLQYQHQIQKRCFLPSQRQISPVKRRYYPQMGLSYSVQKQIKIRQTQNSNKIKPILEYAQADHVMSKITPKVGEIIR